MIRFPLGIVGLSEAIPGCFFSLYGGYTATEKTGRIIPDCLNIFGADMHDGIAFHHCRYVIPKPCYGNALSLSCS